MKNIVVIVSIFATAIATDIKIGGTTYFDYTSGDEISAFNFTRQYVSFSGKASDKVQYKVFFDVGRVAGDPLTAFLKKAQIDYKASFANISMGMIGTNSYGVQEKNWGYRFIEKSAIDKNGFSSTTDFSKISDIDKQLGQNDTDAKIYRETYDDRLTKLRKVEADIEELRIKNNEVNDFMKSFVYHNEKFFEKCLRLKKGNFRKLPFSIGIHYLLPHCE